jgi:glycosyltransferase involved in cell wall biosynthesis
MIRTTSWHAPMSWCCRRCLKGCLAPLEALYLGVPCVLRAVDGNAELIREGTNGTLFRENTSLAAAMAATAAWSRALTGKRESLLPDAYRQGSAVSSYLALLDCGE